MFLLCRCGGLRGGIAALHDFHPHSRVRHWDRLWPSLVKGEGDSVGCVGLFHPRLAPPCGFPPTRESTARDAGMMRQGVTAYECAGFRMWSKC